MLVNITCLLVILFPIFYACPFRKVNDCWKDEFGTTEASQIVEDLGKEEQTIRAGCKRYQKFASCVNGCEFPHQAYAMYTLKALCDNVDGHVWSTQCSKQLYDQLPRKCQYDPERDNLLAIPCAKMRCVNELQNRLECGLPYSSFIQKHECITGED